MARGGVADSEASAAGTQRLDKWLWFARVTKSRTLAQTAISEGKIRLNKERVEKPAQTVKVGDVVTSRIRKDVQVFKIVGLGVRRGPAKEAQALYEDLSPPVDAQVGAAPRPVWAEREAGAGRPSKRDRRKIIGFKQGSS